MIDSVDPGRAELLRLRLTAERLRALRRAGTLTLAAATNRDAAGGTPARSEVTVTKPLPRRRR